MRIPLYIAVVLAFFCFKSFAQPRQEYLFTYLGVRDGLPEDNIRAVQQDEKGYIWMATSNTIERYDGQRFLSFSHKSDDPGSIPPGGIRSMLVDKKNRLWLLSQNQQVGFIDVNNFRYQPVKVQKLKGDYNADAATLHLDEDGHVMLIYVGRGFITFSESANEFAEAYSPFKLPEGWEPFHFWQDKKRNYWVGTPSGLLKYNPVKKAMSYRGHNVENDPFIKHYEALKTAVFVYIDATDRCWVTAWPDNKLTIRSFSARTGEAKEWLDIGKALKNKYFELKGVVELSDSSIWLVGYNLFAKINSRTSEVEPVESDGSGEYSLRYDEIFSLYEDREKNVWICSNKGLFRFNPSSQHFRKIPLQVAGRDTLFTPDVNDVLQMPDGEILAGTWGSGIFSYNSQFRPVVSKYVNRITPPGEGMVWCITRRKNGDLWRGVQEGYIFIYNAATKQTTRLRPPIFENSTVRQIVEDAQGNLWIGTQRGHLVKWDATSNTFSLKQKFKATVSRLLLDSRNEIWVCTDRNGVFKIDNTGAVRSHYTSAGPPSKSLRINGASDIIEYNDSTMVIASAGLNILNLRTQTFKYFTTDNGLPNDNVSNLVTDRFGYIWMSTTIGILSYHPASRKLSTYNALDGVHNTAFIQASSSVLNDGTIVFGTNHDLLVFDPARVTVADYVPPKVEIASFVLMNKPVSLDSLNRLSRVWLRHFEHSISIALTTLTFQNRYEIYYQMEGLDKEWIAAGKNNQAIFNYLPPGKYIFKAGCKDSKGNMGRLTTLEIRVQSPFWKSWWFYALLLLAISAGIYLADRQRIQRIKREQQLRAGIAANLHEDVNSTLQNIHVLSEIAGMKADVHPEQSKDYIQEIKLKSRNMVAAMNEVLWSIDPVNDSMKKTIDRIQELTQSFQNGSGMSVDIFIDPRVQKVALDMRKRHEFVVIYKLAMASIAALPGQSENKVQLDMVRNTLSLKIISSQKHLHKQGNTIIKNLNEMKKRADSIDATLDVQTDDTGTFVMLAVKL